VTRPVFSLRVFKVWWNFPPRKFNLTRVFAHMEIAVRSEFGCTTGSLLHLRLRRAQANSA